VNPLRGLLYLLFPPVCLHCKGEVSASYLCAHCWELSALIDPSSRCLHCFAPKDTPHPLCPVCGHRPLHPFPKAALFEREAPICRWLNQPEWTDAFAAFAYLQWEKLEWDLPDFIVPLLPSAKQWAAELSTFLQKPSIDPFQRAVWPLEAPQWDLKELFSEEEAIFLLLSWHHSPKEELAAFRALMNAFPKKVYLLTAQL
jgi:hypothetical protein